MVDSSQALIQQQSQKLRLNKNQIQRLEVLRMPLLELSGHIYEQLLENPVLELVGDVYPTESIDTQQIIEAERMDELHSEMDISFDLNEGRKYVHAAEDLSAQVSTGRQTFTDLLQEQLALLRLDEGQHIICGYLIQCLDRRGYLKDDIGELAEILGVTQDEILQAMYTLQGLKPVGVAARTLQECLILQLFEIGKLDKYTIGIVRQGLGYLAQNNMVAIAKLLGVEKDDAVEYCSLIRSLNPIPSAGYDTGEQPSSIIPDVIITKTADGFLVSLTASYAAKLTLNRDYQDMMSGDNSDVKGYLKEHKAQAKLLISALREREHTLTRIIKCALSRQPDYFATGQNLQPMTMQQVASELGLHVSTISRAVQDKYIMCRAGTVPLKALFSQGVETVGQTISPSYIKERIKACVASEDKCAPLSDEDIRAALKLLNIDISRRTVAKYRESEGIPSSRLRRRY